MTYTSIEQSKALMHLGLDEKTADLWWAEIYKGKLVELGSEHIKYVKNPYCFAGGVNVGMSKAYQDILNKLHEEQYDTRRN